jgi:hypothetical protein
MARKLCACFGIMLWQTALSEDPHKLEEITQQQAQQTGQVRTLLLGGYRTCEQKNIKITIF